jgi:hypothetical protein
MVATVPNRKESVYGCKICGLENLHTKMDQTDLPVTRASGTSFSFEDSSSESLYLDTGDTLTLSDGSSLTLSSSMSVRYGYETTTSSMYASTSISFSTAGGVVQPAKILDSNYRFGDQHIQSNMLISISSTSGTNDGNYTIADRGVSRGEILLSTSDSLTTETAAAAGTVIISRILFKANILTGCPLCGSLNSVNGTPPN